MLPVGRKTGPQTGSNQTDMGSFLDVDRDVRDVSRSVLATISTQKAMAAAHTGGFTGATVTEQQLSPSCAGTTEL